MKHLHERLNLSKNIQIALMLNLAIFICEIIGIIIRFHTKGSLGIEYYTMDSNLLTLVASAILIFYIVTHKRIPKWLSLLRYTATTMLSVTFLVVVLILAPMLEHGYAILLLTDQMLYNHLICPILSFISFVFFEEHPFKLRDINWPIGVTILYAIILVALNLCHVVDGPYPFLQVYDHSVLVTLCWTILILGGTTGISYGLLRLRRLK